MTNWLTPTDWTQIETLTGPVARDNRRAIQLPPEPTNPQARAAAIITIARFINEKRNA
jgi:hypothetical protein